MSALDLRARATEPEQLDEGVPEAEALRSLADLRFVNRWLGNRGSVLRAVRAHLPAGGRLLDVGCGSGDVPAFLQARLPGPLLAVGVDVKALHLRAAPPSVRRVVADVRRLPFPDRAFDVVTASLFLHHFAEADLPAILAGLHRLARRALVVNDLHRARVPYLFGRAAFPLLFRSRVSVEDGLLSIRRGFRADELRAAFARAGLPAVTVRRLFPYRLLAVATREERPPVSVERRDVVVVGGGPAGSAVACLLAQRGHDVLLLDSARFPRDKVCGEGVSPEAWRLLDAMGAAGRVRDLAPHPLRGMRLVSPDGTSFRGEYRGRERPGFAVRRLALDAALLDAARAAGVEVREGARVTGLVRESEGVTGVVAEAGGERRASRARVTVGADGRRSVVARSLGLLREHPRMRRFAVRGYWEGVEALGDVGEMHVGRRGYCGVAPLSATLANVAFVLDRREMAPAGGDLEAFYRAALRRRWPRLAERLEGAHLDVPPRAIGPLALECRAVAAPGAVLVGDAAGFYDPFTGEGVDPRPAYGRARGWRHRRGPRATAAAPAGRLLRYERARAAATRDKFRFNRLLQVAVGWPDAANAVARRLARRPDLADRLVGIAGDFVPARAALGPRFLWDLLRA